jgi:hypothetical protein
MCPTLYCRYLRVLGWPQCCSLDSRTRESGELPDVPAVLEFARCDPIRNSSSNPASPAAHNIGATQIHTDIQNINYETTFLVIYS